MSEPGPKMTAAFANRDHRAEIVERLYDVAVDPIRLEQLLDIWEVRAAPLRVGQLDLALVPDAPEIEARVARATVFLDRLKAVGGHAVRALVWPLSSVRPRFWPMAGR